MCQDNRKLAPIFTRNSGVHVFTIYKEEESQTKLNRIYIAYIQTYICIANTAPDRRKIDYGSLLHERKEMPYYIDSSFKIGIYDSIHFCSW